jgi:putative membrane protein insertion efficiency factor
MIAKLLKGLIRLYQLLLSPFWGAQCRFHPSCSCYAMEALDKHGALKGTGLAVYRILRCNPWADGGLDPVPEKKSKK